VERVCRDSTVYNPQEVKAFLMDAKLPDPKPLIYVCDRHGFIEEMTGYLYTNNLKKVRESATRACMYVYMYGRATHHHHNKIPRQYIEVYVQRVSPPKTPQVVGKLLDLDCNEDFVRMLLTSVGAACPVEELVEQVGEQDSCVYVYIHVCMQNKWSPSRGRFAKPLLKSECPRASLLGGGYARA
jgi:clathrin heavy chain